MSSDLDVYVSMLTPVEQLKRDYPILKGIDDISKSWARRWSDVPQPWPSSGSFDEGLIQNMRVLVEAHKAHQKTGRRGKARKEKRDTELAVLTLFGKAGRRRKAAVEAAATAAQTEKEEANDKTDILLSDIDAPFTHTAPVLTPPPYEAQTEATKAYPQLPVLNSEGRYVIRDDNNDIMQKGNARTTVVTHLDVKRKTKKLDKHPTPAEKKKKKKSKKGRHNSDSGSSEEEGADIGGYSERIRQIMARAERRGRKGLETDSSSSSEEESEESDSDDGAKAKEQVNKELRDMEKELDSINASKTELESELYAAKKGEDVTHLEDALRDLAVVQSEMQTQTRQMQKELEKHDLRPRPSKPEEKSKSKKKNRRKTKGDGKMFPVVVSGAHMNYKPWQASDMSAILDKLPILQDGAYPWTTKIDQLSQGISLAMGDIKRILSSVLGVPPMEEILEKAGIGRCAHTAIYDAELFAANRGRLWRTLKEMFPTNVHPDDIIFNALGDTENPRAYAARVYQQWRELMGNDPEEHKLERAMLRLKLQEGLPQSVRSKVGEVVGLGSMVKNIYIDHIAHLVEHHRKKERALKEQDAELKRQLTQSQLLNGKWIEEE